MFSLKFNAFSGICIYVILALHVMVLFPDLTLPGQLFQAILRWLVLASAVLATYLLQSHKSNKIYLFLKWFFGLLIIPYPIYNIFQIRHIAEIFPLASGEHFAPGNHVNFIWKCLPTIIYSFVSGIIGFICIYVVAEKYFNSILLKLIFSTIIIGVSTAAALYGLHSRLDTYHLFTRTFSIWKDVIFVFSEAQALKNLLICTGIFLYIYLQFSYFLKFASLKNQTKLLP